MRSWVMTPSDKRIFSQNSGSYAFLFISTISALSFISKLKTESCSVTPFSYQSLHILQ